LRLVILRVVAKLQIVVGLAAGIAVFTSATILAVLAVAFPRRPTLLLVLIVDVEAGEMVVLMRERARVDFEGPHHEQGTVCGKQL
jgi:hypothetical protein